MSTTTQLTGLASGLDWRTLVDKLVAAERTPETALRTKQTTYQQQSNAFDNFKTKLTDLQTSIQALGATSDAFGARTASVTAGSGWSATAASGIDSGSYVINVSQLATRAQQNGASDVGAQLSSTSDVSGLTIGTLPIAATITAGEFTVNGQRITVATTDSLQDVFNQISSKTGVAVTASYDPSTDKVQLSSSSEIVVGSANDSSNFLSALQLFNNGTGNVISPKALGVVSVSAAIKNANLKTAVTAVDSSGNGTFKINGVEIGYNVNTDSLQGIISKINASTAGVTATFDKTNDRVILTNKTTGDTGISVSEASGGLLESLGLNSTATFVHGKNAQFTVNDGDTRTSTSNIFDETATGITGLSVTATSETEQTVTVGADNSGLRSKIEDFISKFNAVQTFIETATKSSTSSDGVVTSAVLAGNHDVSGTASNLRGILFAGVPSLTGTIQRLDSLGIDFTAGTSQLQIKDSTALDTALSNNVADVKTLFTDSGSGLATRLDAYITQATGSTGLIATQTQTLTKQSSDIDDQVAAMEKRILSEQARLEASFEQMETAQSNLQTQLAALTSAFGTSSTSK